MFGISAFAEAPFASLTNQAAVVSLTGVSATGAAGTITVGERSFALTGVGAVGSVGSITDTNSPTENGVLATGEVGTVTVETT